MDALIYESCINELVLLKFIKIYIDSEYASNHPVKCGEVLMTILKTRVDSKDIRFISEIVSVLIDSKV